MNAKNTYPVHGFIGEYGNEGYFTRTIPFFRTSEGLIFTNDSTKPEPEVGNVEPGEERFIFTVEAKAEGTLRDTVILTGTEFLNKLALLNISNNISSWNKDDPFIWTVSSVEAYEKQQKTFKEHAVTWLTNHLRTHKLPVEETVEAAISIIHSSESMNRDDFILTGFAQKRMGDERGYRMNAIIASATFTEAPFSSERDYFKHVEKLEKTFK
jgi:hypothetical protein